MIPKIKFENTTQRHLQACIEPMLDYVDWLPGELLEIDLRHLRPAYQDELNFALTESGITIYETRQYEMTISIVNEVKYVSPHW